MSVLCDASVYCVSVLPRALPTARERQGGEVRVECFSTCGLARGKVGGKCVQSDVTSESISRAFKTLCDLGSRAVLDTQPPCSATRAEFFATRGTLESPLRGV